ncbi:hypothetical protein SPI_05026 [Niveomyces insectorum RCEF 264]|uniref:Uncharacterized protein n=1 Tax=Niveomyces insectorum RCEF 264 TaxID=1081102 RepID=A0A167TVS7_9HYPO|nr:hypothetical protein SPI_05026 [Niveomyces insectorum RCEF 264]
MAAPASKSINDLNGKWRMNKSLSDPFEPVLALQGVGYIVRKAISAATLTLHVRQYEAPPSEPTIADDPVDDAARQVSVTHVDIDQTLTGGFKGTTERRCCDDRRREHSDWLFGHVVGRTRWYRGPGAAAAVVRDFGGEAFLAKGWSETTGNDNDGDLLVSHVVNQDAGNGWVAAQTWGFQPVGDSGENGGGGGARRYVRNIVVTKGEGAEQQRQAVQLVYDFVGERDDADGAAAEDEDADLDF